MSDNQASNSSVISLNCSTLVDILRHRAIHQADQTAFIFLQDGKEESQLTYKYLDQQARAIAALLQRLKARGERALLLYPAGLEFITAFFGCLYAGVVAVPAYPPRTNNRSIDRLQAILADAQATVLLTTTQTLPDVEQRFVGAPNLGGVHLLTTDNVVSGLEETWRDPTVSSDTLAYLQYTSGSTSTPKGVMISHANAIHNSADLALAWETTSNSVLVSWLPHFHDFGLVYGIIQPVYQGFPCVLMAPTSFIQRPIRWLQAISRYRATHSGAPNFAYELCIQKIGAEQCTALDLSSWCVAVNGAEPIRQETLQKFTQAFEPYGFRWSTFCPGYGLAEATLKVSAARRTEVPIFCTVQVSALEQHQIELSENQSDMRSLVGCGSTLLDTKMIIVNPASLTRCLPNQVGEIWVSGSSVSLGYWNRPDETERTFCAYLADTGEGPFLRTGDLGFIKDDQLFVTGRLKDLIIIRGANYYPQDIEQTVEQSHPVLRPSCGAAFSIEVEDEERLVVAQEVERSYLKSLNIDEVIRAIYKAVAQQHDLQVYAVLLLKTGSIPKTSSGKIQRQACRANFLAGSLDVIGDWIDSQSQAPQQQVCKQRSFSERNNSDRQASSYMTSQKAETIQAWLISKIAERLRVNSNDIDVREPFAYYGLDSVVAVSISGELEDWLGCTLSPTLLYNYPTIKALALHLAGESDVSETSFQVDIQQKTEIEAIAIIGMSCRFPGAKDPEAFWQMLQSGADAITEVPRTRWNINAFYDPAPGTPGKMSTRWGGFLEQVDQFDPHFFGIAPKEAECIDPQQRLLLEVAWEALENGGQPPDKLAGSQTGVFIGISSNDYSRFQFEDSTRVGAYAGTGIAFSIAANRLSYLLDLRGPSLAVDTACSSSLVAVNLACQSLHNRECHLALAGGVNLILSPDLTITFSQAGMMAADGRCKTFDASADGYVRGEGCGIVLLKRLSDALKDGDNILGLIRGCAVNQDGRSNGLTAPNGPSQQAVIRQALENAGVAPAQISYVEAHGTGTSLGDQIELNSLKEVLMQERVPDLPCWIGSVKTNIGHLEAAAGIAGLIKVVLSLQHGEIPHHLNLKQLNPHINLEGTPLSIPTERQKWTRGKERRLAGVSSFGFGGTNAHVILEEGPIVAPVVSEVERPKHILTLSAKNEKALRELAQSYATYLEYSSETSVADICFTANTGRLYFAHRLFVVAESIMQLREHLNAFSTFKQTNGLVSGKVCSSQWQKIAFLFSGQGSQYIDMGRQLYETQPTFRQALVRCDQILRSYLEKPLLEVLYPAADGTSPLDETAYTQPALFALEYALFQLWRSWGVNPAVVMGHSVGEYVAACVAGVFSLEDGLKLIAARGRLMQSLPQDGEMVAVLTDEARVTAAIQPYVQQVSIAAINGPESFVISGQRQAVKAVCITLEAAGVKTKKLQVSHAFHSPLIEPMLVDFERVASDVTYSLPQIGFISNITGEMTTAEIATPEYWCRHVRQPVRFAAGMKTLFQQGYEVFLEIGPKPTLLGMGRNCLPSGVGKWFPSLRPGQADWQQLLQSLGALYVLGVPVDWSGFDRDYQRRRVVMPNYPFQRQRYWVETAENGCQKAGTLFPKQVQTPIINLLNQGDTGQLAQMLGKAGNFSEKQMKFLPELLELLVQQHQQQIAAAPIQDWLYQVEWQPKPRQLKNDLAKIQAKECGSWLILADLGGVGQALAKLLQQQGQSCTLAYIGDVYQRRGINTWSLNPSSRADFDHLFKEVLAAELPLRGIIHLWSLEAALPHKLTVSALEQAQTWSCGSVLHLLQTLGKHDGLTSPQMWLVTRGAQPVGVQPSSLAVAQSPLWGLGKVVALEYPQLWGGMLDLAPDATADEIAMLLTEIVDSQGEDHIAFREGQRYVTRLVRSQPTQSQGVELCSNSNYLITGGLGALGLQVAQWMVKQGARQLVLTGRSGPSSQAQTIIARMEQAGARVIVAQADVASWEDMVRVFEQVKATMSPLRGIIHTAGIASYQTIKDMDIATFESVLRPKVVGTWILHQLTQKMELSFFVGFSSIASVWGSKGQAHYAAANHFLDGMAYYRRQLGMPALSINWGPWQGGGMASVDTLAWLTRMGVEALQPDLAVAALGYLLGQDCVQTTVANVDWASFKTLYEARGQKALLEQIETQLQKEDPQVLLQRHELLQQLQEAPRSKYQELLITHLQKEVASVLGFEPSQLPNPQQGFFEMGMDSLMAVQLKSRLEASLGFSLPATLAFEHPTIKDLAKYLVKEVMSCESLITNDSQLSQGKDEQAEALTKIKQLSADKVEASIAQKLTKLEILLRGN